VLDLSEMKGLEVNVAERTAWAETGLTAGEYTAAMGTHGLATGFGDTGSVGIGGSRWAAASGTSCASTASR
jgi:FAD/FMN-containing dehydrogenase